MNHKNTLFETRDKRKTQSTEIRIIEREKNQDKLLFEIQLNLSKISAIIYFAIPIIKIFLSSKFPFVKNKYLKLIKILYLIGYMLIL